MSNSQYEIIREVLAAWRDVPGILYRRDGLGHAALFVMVSPILIPLAAIFYFSMGRETRELLDESNEYAG